LKNTIWSKILLFVVIPFFAVYTLLSAFIIRSIFVDKMEQVELNVRNLARFNEINFQKYIENTRLSVMIAAAELELIDPSSPDARSRGEQIIISSFHNEVVYNSWLIFEPNAFDGRDAEHRGEYPGETSGRYMRSYIRQDSSYVVTPDMDENSLEDMDASYWYIVPKLTGKPFIDINTEYEMSWDYRTGGEPIYSITLSAPIQKDGKIIGCVGQDILLTDIILGSELIPGAVSALITPNGILRYYHDHSLLGKSIEELGFADAGNFYKIAARGGELFASGEYSPLLQAPASAFYKPVMLEDFNELLYIYTAVPENVVMKSLYGILGPIAYSLVFVLLIFMVSQFYISWGISKPIHSLILACEAISQGNFDTVIAQPHSRGEIGIMTQSLYRMVEQFKIYIAMQERSQDLLEIYIRLHNALYQHDRIEDVFDEIIPLISDYFRLYRASLVVVSEDGALLRNSFERGLGVKKRSEYFAFHRQAASLLAERKYISMNLNAMRGQTIDFTGEETRYLCILPFLASGRLEAYVIMEGDSETGPLVHSDTALLFISQTVSYILSRREFSQQEAAGGREPAVKAEAEPPAEIRETAEPAEPKAEGAAADGGEESPLQAARSIEGLDVDQGLFHAGGDAEQYGNLLRISARSFEGKMEKMRSFYETDLPAFAIDIHGIKGALYAIGAADLGDEAKTLEFAAKAGEADRCLRGYPVFEEKLAVFTKRLAAIPRRREMPVKGPGDISTLAASLKEALEASRLFDTGKAGGIIGGLLQYSWDGAGPEITENLEKTAEALESMDYDETEQTIGLLLEALS
jgi:HAMP domain-containing protein/HPt (histidine-containing phosphotransfer) domain-containing protein